jgi:hypothetical protein
MKALYSPNSKARLDQYTNKGSQLGQFLYAYLWGESILSFENRE